MDQTPFMPELSAAPSELSNTDLLSTLPGHYLDHPTASNYVALGVVYTLMGLASPENLASPTYLDRTLMGIFTALNDKAVDLGLPAFEPPTPLEHPVMTRLAALVDAQINRKNAGGMGAGETPLIKFVVNYIFGKNPQEAHVGSLKSAGVVNHAIDHVIEQTGKAFPPSTDMGGTWNYDAIVGRGLRDAGIVNPDVKEEFISWMLLNKLQPTSTWVINSDETKGHLGNNFSRFMPRFISDYLSSERTHREVGMDSTDEDGNTIDFFDTYSGSSFPGEKSQNTDESLEDIKKILGKFRQFLVENGDRYHSDGGSLVRILDMLYAGMRPSDIKEALGLTAGPYSARYNKIFEAGQDFKRRFPAYASVMEPLLQ